MANSNFDAIITDIIKAEVGDKPNGGFTNDPTDKGGRTQFGIAEASNPQAWLDGKVTEQEARAIYLQKYVIFPKFHTIPPEHGNLQKQLIDYGVTSGQLIAVQKLQIVLGVDVDGRLGPQTLGALAGRDPRDINNAVVKERCLMIGRVVRRDLSQIKYLVGWLDRALGFLV